MTYECDAPAVVPACVLDTVPPDQIGLDCDWDDCQYLTALGFAKAASFVMEHCGLGCPADDCVFVTYGPPSSLPNECESIGVGIIGYDSDSDGLCWSANYPILELLISTCKPSFNSESRSFPAAGPEDGCRPDTMNGHALRRFRIDAAMQRNLSRVACCYLPEDCSCGDKWRVSAVVIDDTEVCAQTRYTITRA